MLVLWTQGEGQVITGDTTDWPSTRSRKDSAVITGDIRLKDIVEIRAVKTRGRWKWREIQLERYVNGQLTGISWVRAGDNIRISINLSVS